VGSYYAGNESIQLVLREGNGGDFWCVPGRGKLPYIKIGADDDWNSIFTTLLHEIFEFLLERVKGRYYPSADVSHSSASYLFVIDHQDFGDVCARAAEFVDDCLPDLKKEYKLWRKNRKNILP